MSHYIKMIHYCISW